MIPQDEGGMTLPELLVGMTLLGIVTAILLVGVLAVYRGQNLTEQDSDSLATLRVGLDRIEKELRQARKVYAGANDEEISFWVDRDRDNQQDPVERVHWTVADQGEGVAFLTRWTEADPSDVRVVSRGFVYEEGYAYFSYNTDEDEDDITYPQASTVVSLSFRADTELGQLSPERQVRTEVRLRNASKETD